MNRRAARDGIQALHIGKNSSVPKRLAADSPNLPANYGIVAARVNANGFLARHPGSRGAARTTGIRSASAYGCFRNRALCASALRPAMKALPLQHCLGSFERAGVPAGPVNDLASLFADPHVRARGAVVEIEHPQLGPVKSLASPMRLSETPVRYDRRPALLGEHTRETLAGLSGLGDLVLTCTGSLSRNRHVGVELARGRAIADVVAGMKMVAEGVRTTGAALALGKQYGVELPIATQMAAVLAGHRSAAAAVEELMLRLQKTEQESR